MKTKIRLMNRVEQTIIIAIPKFMVNEVVQVWREKETGTITGLTKGTKYPVIYDKSSDTWSLQE